MFCRQVSNLKFLTKHKFYPCTDSFFDLTRCFCFVFRIGHPSFPQQYQYEKTSWNSLLSMRFSKNSSSNFTNQCISSNFLSSRTELERLPTTRGTSLAARGGACFGYDAHDEWMKRPLLLAIWNCFIFATQHGQLYGVHSQGRAPAWNEHLIAFELSKTSNSIE